jgi:hypothetical protein
MRAITPELEELLRSRFQAAASGYRGRIEVDRPTEETTELSALANRSFGGTVTAAGSIPPANPTNANDNNTGTASTIGNGVLGAGTYTGWWQMDLGEPMQIERMYILQAAGQGEAMHLIEVSENGSSWSTATGVTQTAHTSGGYMTGLYGGGGLLENQTCTVDFAPPLTFRHIRIAHQVVLTGLGFFSGRGVVEWHVMAREITHVPPGTATDSYRVHSISLNRGFSLVADGATIEIPNEDLALGFGAGSVIPTGSRLRIFQWYGDAENEVLTFTGLVDVVRDSRDLLRTQITARDLMVLLTDQTFSAHAPQGADEEDADRTPANGVFISMEVSAIVEHILDEAGWPVADRAITATSYVLDEYIIGDGATWASAIIGPDRLTGLVGFFAWADEEGTFRFAPTPAANILADPGDPAYTYLVGDAGETELTSGHVTSLQVETTGYPIRTRVKVRGPLTTLKDAWTELWRTTKVTRPVGIWYDPTTPAQIRVLDRGTKRLYRLDQATREVLGSANLSAVVPYPLGLSGDPSDSSVYWVLNAPWAFTGSTSGNQVKKLRKSDHVVLAAHSIPNGRWSAIKVSASHVYLTNLDTDRFYRRSKTDLSAVADYSHTVDSVTQLNPSGIMVDGTTLFLFWYNSGNTPRFLLCDESAPGTVTGTIVTAGVTLVGGEMDTTTHTECWGGSDLAGLVAKFTLVEPVENDVAVEVIDTELEDELGALAQTEPRTHDAHPGDAAHSWLMRRETLNLPMISSLAQATETAQRRLELLARRDRVVDVGIVGNPALQKADVLAVTDPATSLTGRFVVDVYRTEMTPESYVGTLALLPAGPADTDDPEDDGEGSE